MHHRVSTSTLAMMFILLGATLAAAKTVRVPADHPNVQSALDAAEPGDVVSVAAGLYRERLRLRPGVTLTSDGDDAPGEAALQRAERTIIDGGGSGDAPGVVMAEGSRLDGLTITNVGSYDDDVWRQHFESRGEKLGDDEGAAGAEGTVPAVQIPAVNCVVTRCIVHHNGDVGIGVNGRDDAAAVPLVAENLVYRNMGGGIGVAGGAQAVIERNICRENLRAGIGCRASAPLIVGNLCTGNVRAGIGCREGARPVIRDNRCHNNRRAGIGIRMENTAPHVAENECIENGLAGIGVRDGAAPLLIRNECRSNERAGIGVESGARPSLQDNRCIDNRLVAIGVIGNSTATIIGNELTRTGGPAPLIAVREGSTATIQQNRLSGGGVAAILVQGTANISDNTFTARSDNQGTAVWIWKDSTAGIHDNTIDGYRTAVKADQSRVTITGNQVRRFQQVAIIVNDTPEPACIYGNTAVSEHQTDRVVKVTGTPGVVSDNHLKSE
ncbi:MAG: right-handed parallel beta-helix repeat-containing protein [Planctomycetaceae bacterium]|nr:right-handed parallel beta-helix repeat-containing protein [Planctomycetaceae bacterium]